MMVTTRYQWSKNTARSIALWCTVRQHVVFCLTTMLLKNKVMCLNIGGNVYIHRALDIRIVRDIWK
jgi:hypothetical protein